jgi:signal transduction histidine kinase
LSKRKTSGDSKVQGVHIANHTGASAAMHALPPAIVSLLFLCYGAYVLLSRGVSRISLTFFLLCCTTFCWQFTWALLYLCSSPQQAYALAKTGYLLILFLPTTLYHFITELTMRPEERRRVQLSYAVAAVLGWLLLTTDWLVAGLHSYFFGYYPRAGVLHPLHLLQTAAVVARGLALLYGRLREAVSTERTRLRFCLVSVLIYVFAAVDYLCNYGWEFYPPGALFVLASLGLIAQAMVRHNLLADPIEVAATIAHEMRTPLATMRNQSRALARCLPGLLGGYRHALEHGYGPVLQPAQLAYLEQLGQHIEAEVNRANFIVDMMLASARGGALSREEYAHHSVQKCVEEALACYPFESAMRGKVTVRAGEDFVFYGSDILLVYVLYNLFKNALQAIHAAGRGELEIAFFRRGGQRQLEVTDTGAGIPAHVLPHIFDPFYTTRQQGGGTGMGLAFCRRVMQSFGGKIVCESQDGSYTRVMMLFP